MIEPLLDAPIPGQSLTAELGARPWQNPPQYNTVEEVLDYYIPRLSSDEVAEQLLDVLEMGVPVTTIADTMQTAGIMEGKHSVDVGMLVLPVLIELIMFIADTAKIDYETGLEKPEKIRGTLVDKAVRKFELAKEKESEEEPVLKEEEATEVIEGMATAAKERAGGLMGRRT